MRFRRTLFTGVFKCISIIVLGQNSSSVFKHFDFHEADSFRLTKSLRFYEILCSKTGEHKFSSSYGLIRDKGMEIEILLFTGANDKTKKLQRNFGGEDSIRSMSESPSRLVFFVSHDNRILWQPSDDGGIGFTPFSFPPVDRVRFKVSKIWIDTENNIYIGTGGDNLYFIQHGGALSAYDGALDSAGNFKIKKGEKPVVHVVLAPNAEIYSFAQDPVNQNIVWIGTSNGLFCFSKVTMKGQNVFRNIEIKDKLTITQIVPDGTGNIWFSTLQNGLGHYNNSNSSIKFFNGKKKYSINAFCRKSADEFFVAITDSVPAIFNTTTGDYYFLQDSIFSKTVNSTTDIKLDGFGNLFVIKGGGLFYTDFYKHSKAFSVTPVEEKAYAPFITEVMIMGMPYRSEGNPKNLKSIYLKHYQNSISISYSLAELINYNEVQFSWKVEGYINEWVFLPISGNAIIPAFLKDLSPGKYIFHLRARVGNEEWRTQQAQLEIIIYPPFWQTWWFWVSLILVLTLIISLIVRWRVKSVRNQEREKAKHEKELLELEAHALRAQMNPHFIFNCLNSIKALIQNADIQKSVDYLTTFSKLIRTLFNNSDKRQVTLYDELETCRLYIQLEAMRLNGKLQYHFEINENLDLKSVMVPALIIQPFIENAIWHGIVPKETGRICIKVDGDDHNIFCEIDDNGIGRERSKQKKPANLVIHESKGINLSQARLNLEKILSDKSATVEIIDKYENNKATGTKVIITFNVQ